MSSYWPRYVEARADCRAEEWVRVVEVRVVEKEAEKEVAVKAAVWG